MSSDEEQEQYDVNAEYDDNAFDENGNFTYKPNPNKRTYTKDDQIYGIFSEPTYQKQPTKVDKDQQVLKMMKNRYPHLNFFKEEFQQAKPQQSEDVEANIVQSQQAQSSYHQFEKKKAFVNFKKSTTLEANKGDGIKVHFAHQKPKKNVKFDLQKNTLHNFKQNDNEKLNQEEKSALNRQIYLLTHHFTKLSDDEEDSDSDAEYDQEYKVVWKQSNLKGILKQKSHETPKVEMPHPPIVPPPKKAKVNKNISKKIENEWQKASGIGFSLLKKVGYSGGLGLGKDEQGIIEPVEAVKKNSFAGYGDISVEYDEATEDIPENKEEPKQSKHMQKLEKQWKKKQVAVVKQNQNKPQVDPVMNMDRTMILNNVATGQQALQAVGKGKKDMPAQLQQQMNFIDMTGNDIKEQQSQISNVYSTKQSKLYLSTLQSLQWQLQNQYEKGLAQLERQEQNMKTEKDKIIMINHEQEEQYEKLQYINKQIGTKEQFIIHLQDIDTQSTLKFRTCFNKYPEEFITFNLSALMVKLVKQSINLKTWQGPVSSNDLLLKQYALVKECSTLVKDVLIQKKTQSMNKYTQQLEVILINSQISYSDLKLIRRYVGFMISEVISKLRSYMINDWEPQKQDNLLEFLELWTSDMFIVETDEVAEKQFEHISAIDGQLSDIQSIILPKLELRINDWQFTKDMNEQEYLHIWALPWIQSKFKCKSIESTVIAKLNQTQWVATEEYGYKILHPWAKIIEQDKWNNMMLRLVIPKLLHSIIQIQINPASQDIKPIKNAMLWSDCLGEHLGLVFEKLIDKLRITLEQWLQQQGNKEEMRKWLLGWEQFLFQRVISKVDRFQGILNTMKQLIK